jgi:AcrR family transcriptional regulator
VNKRRVYHHPELRKRLLRAAAAELKESGAAYLSLRSISHRAGVSHAAPYRHFRDKEEIIAALVVETMEDFTKALRTARESGAETAKERLFRIGEAYLEFARSNPERLNLMFSEAGMKAMAHYYIKPPQEKMARYDSFGVLETTVKECQAEGVLDPQGDSGALSILVWSVVHGLSAIEREDLVSSLGAQRGYSAETAHRLVMDAFRALIERNARPAP